MKEARSQTRKRASGHVAILRASNEINNEITSLSSTIGFHFAGYTTGKRELDPLTTDISLVVC